MMNSREEKNSFMLFELNVQGTYALTNISNTDFYEHHSQSDLSN